MRSSSTNVPLLLLASSRALVALKVTPGSPCATDCLDSPAGNEWNTSASTTTTADITCHDDGYSSTASGQKFNKCVDCLQTSVRTYEGESDLHWLIYNLRYTVSTCVYSKPSPALDSDPEPPCDTAETCGPLIDPLTSDGLAPNPNTTWNYCGANSGTFMGSGLAPCISCLRATKNQTYLANFVTALEAGCQQSPANITMLGLSGTLFSSDAVNIVDPSVAANPQPAHPLPLSAIIGIVVGVVLVFGLAVCLFIVHCTQKRASSHLEHFFYYGEPDSPKTLVDPWGYAITQPRRFPQFQDANRGPEKDGTNGELYNRLEEAARSDRIQYAHDPRCPHQGPDNIMPTHQAYNPNAVSRSGGKEKATRAVSPPGSDRRHRYSTPDSFVAQAYLMAVEDASRLPKPAPTRQPTVPEPTSTVPTAPSSQPGWTSRISSIVLPSIPKIRMPKKYAPPRLALKPSKPAEESRERQLRISPPLMVDDPRFHDRPLGNGAVVYDMNRPPTPVNSDKYQEYTEVPLRSGQSLLFGM